MEQFKGIINEEEYNIIVLKCKYNLKFNEIADFYDKPVSSVTNIYHRGVKKIKEVLRNEKGLKKVF